MLVKKSALHFILAFVARFTTNVLLKPQIRKAVNFKINHASFILAIFLLSPLNSYSAIPADLLYCLNRHIYKPAFQNLAKDEIILEVLYDMNLFALKNDKIPAEVLEELRKIPAEDRLRAFEMIKRLGSASPNFSEEFYEKVSKYMASLDERYPNEYGIDQKFDLVIGDFSLLYKQFEKIFPTFPTKIENVAEQEYFELLLEYMTYAIRGQAFEISNNKINLLSSDWHDQGKLFKGQILYKAMEAVESELYENLDEATKIRRTNLAVDRMIQNGQTELQHQSSAHVFLQYLDQGALVPGNKLKEDGKKGLQDLGNPSVLYTEIPRSNDKLSKLNDRFGGVTLFVNTEGIKNQDFFYTGNWNYGNYSEANSARPFYQKKFDALVTPPVSSSNEIVQKGNIDEKYFEYAYVNETYYKEYLKPYLLSQGRDKINGKPLDDFFRFHPNSANKTLNIRKEITDLDYEDIPNMYPKYIRQNDQGDTKKLLTSLEEGINKTSYVVYRNFQNDIEYEYYGSILGVKGNIVTFLNKKNGSIVKFEQDGVNGDIVSVFTKPPQLGERINTVKSIPLGTNKPEIIQTKLNELTNNNPNKEVTLVVDINLQSWGATNHIFKGKTSFVVHEGKTYLKLVTSKKGELKEYFFSVEGIDFKYALLEDPDNFPIQQPGIFLRAETYNE